MKNMDAELANGAQSTRDPLVAAQVQLMEELGIAPFRQLLDWIIGTQELATLGARSCGMGVVGLYLNACSSYSESESPARPPM